MTPTVSAVFACVIALASARDLYKLIRCAKVTCPRWYYEGRTSEIPYGLDLLNYIIFKKFSTTQIIPLAKRVNLTILYEPYSNRSHIFMTEQLLPVYKELNQGINLELLPFGRSTADVSGSYYSFTCPNGIGECLAFKIHACLTYYLNKRKQHNRLVEIISCLMRKMDHRKALSTCCSKSGVQSLRIKKCSKSIDGNILYAHKGKLTSKWIDDVTLIPAVVVDGVYDEAKSEMAVNDLWSFVCTEVPEMCRPRPPPTTRYVRTTTKKSRKKVPKRLRKLRKRNMLQRYNISLNHTLMLAERFWEHKIQKMLAQGCTTDRQWRKTTPRSSRRTTVTGIPDRIFYGDRDEDEDAISSGVEGTTTESGAKLKSDHDVSESDSDVTESDSDVSESDSDVSRSDYTSETDDDDDSRSSDVSKSSISRTRTKRLTRTSKTTKITTTEEATTMLVADSAARRRHREYSKLFKRKFDFEQETGAPSKRKPKRKDEYDYQENAYGFDKPAKNEVY